MCEGPGIAKALGLSKDSKDSVVRAVDKEWRGQGLTFLQCRSGYAGWLDDLPVSHDGLVGGGGACSSPPGHGKHPFHSLCGVG